MRRSFHSMSTIKIEGGMIKYWVLCCLAWNISCFYKKPCMLVSWSIPEWAHRGVQGEQFGAYCSSALVLLTSKYNLQFIMVLIYTFRLFFTSYLIVLPPSSYSYIYMLLEKNNITLVCDHDRVQTNGRIITRVCVIKQGLIATRLSVLEALIFKVDENIHPWTSTFSWKCSSLDWKYSPLVTPAHVYSWQCTD